MSRSEDIVSSEIFEVGQCITVVWDMGDKKEWVLGHYIDMNEDGTF